VIDGVGVIVGVSVMVGVGVTVGVFVAVGVDVKVGVDEGVAVTVAVAVGVGVGLAREAIGTALQPAKPISRATVRKTPARHRWLATRCTITSLLNRSQRTVGSHSTAARPAWTPVLKVHPPSDLALPPRSVLA
jgi:hypothetical protein